MCFHFQQRTVKHFTEIYIVPDFTLLSAKQVFRMCHSRAVTEKSEELYDDAIIHPIQVLHPQLAECDLKTYLTYPSTFG
jgi:hypothetical protein